MSDWWGSITKGATDAAETTKLAAQRTKLQAEVLYLEQQIKGILQKFGVDVFAHMESNNSAQVQQHFTEAKREVDVFRAGGGEERGDRGYQQADGERRQGAGRRCPGGSRHVIDASCHNFYFRFSKG